VAGTFDVVLGPMGSTVGNLTIPDGVFDIRVD